MLPQLHYAKTLESHAVSVVGFSPATLVFVSKQGVAYGYPVVALKRAFNWSFAQVMSFYRQIESGDVSAGRAWSQVKKACESTGKTYRKYTSRQSVCLIKAAIFKQLECE